MVITDVNQVVYQGNGSNTAFPFTFRIIDATDIKLLLIDADGTETDITSDYFVDINTNTVHYPGYAPGSEPAEADQPAPVQTGQKLMIYRKLPITQEKDLGDKWPFSVIELGMDKLTMILQDIWDWCGRCLQVSRGQAAAAGDDFDPTIPLEADKVIAGNANGTGFDAREAMMEVNGAWDGEGRQIHGVADPTAAGDAATKGYVDTLTDGNFMKLQDGGTAWEGRGLPVSNIATPGKVKDATTKEYVDNLIDKLSVEADRYVVFNNVAAMKAADLPAGYSTRTLGYHDINDGGAGTYSIRGKVAGETEDGGSVIFLDNGNVAELVCNSVSYACFGAVSDGESESPTNNYERIKACHLYANKTGNPVVNYGGKYYITGRPAIPVESDVYNYGDTTYYIGTDNLKRLALFALSHDSETSVQGVALSTVMSNDTTVKYGYQNKAFLIETSVSLGLNQDQGGTTMDSMIEPMLSIGDRANLYFDKYKNVKDWIVNITHITDATEKGYVWDGGIIKNKDESTYGTCLLSVQRNNCTIRNMTISCNSVIAENATIHAEFANNLLVENIVVTSISDEDTWGYWLESHYGTNITVRNVHQSGANNKVNSWAQRTMKNCYCLNNVIKSYDCHWNAYGIHLVENCQIRSHAHVGYGKGKFIVRNSDVSYYVGGRTDIVPIYAGDIIVEDCRLGIYGIWLKTAPTIDSTRDMTYFAKIPVPRIFGKRNVSLDLINARAITNYLPLAITDILEDRIKIVLEGYKNSDIFYTGDSTAKCKHFDVKLVDYTYPYYSALSSFYDNIDSPSRYFNVMSYQTGLVSEITLNSAIDVNSSDALGVNCSNGTKTLHIDIYAKGTLPAWSTIATLNIPSVAPPARAYGFLVVAGTSTNIPVRVYNDGTIVIESAINVTSYSRIVVIATW